MDFRHLTLIFRQFLGDARSGQSLRYLSKDDWSKAEMTYFRNAQDDYFVQCVSPMIYDLRIEM